MYLSKEWSISIKTDTLDFLNNKFKWMNMHGWATYIIKRWHVEKSVSIRYLFLSTFPILSTFPAVFFFFFGKTQVCTNATSIVLTRICSMSAIFHVTKTEHFLHRKNLRIWRRLKEIRYHSFTLYQKRSFRCTLTYQKLASIDILKVKETNMKKIFHTLFISILVN